MRVPLSWLADFAPFDARADDPGSVRALGEVMDDLGMVVEAVEEVGRGLDDVVVSRVREIHAIPGADRVRRVVVDAGGPEAVQVVCGAWNFQEGDLVPFAPVGTELPGGLTIGRRKLKGVTSNGMLCSGAELSVSEDAAGLLVLDGGPATAAPGTPVGEALGLGADVVYDLTIETNRPDAMSVGGVARDLAARLGLPFHLPEPPDLASPPASGPGAPDLASLVVVADDLCPRFVARVLDDAHPGPSPPWLARRLLLAGMRPINLVVDASNYVMLELGQPTHPYDLDRLAGRGLLVRRAAPRETLVTLDGVERVLGWDQRREAPAEDLLICDAEGGPVGIAGVMGGASSEIGSTTTRVLLEAAWFQPMAVARTSRRLGLRTAASARFERGCDPEGIERAVARVCELVAGEDGGAARVVPGALEAEGALPPRPRIRLRTARVNAILGTTLADDQVRAYLAPLGFEVAPTGSGTAEVVVPSWRPDTHREIDVIEEVARHHGYGSIPRTRPTSPRVGGLSPHQRGRRTVRAALVGLGASEAWTSSMVAPEDHQAVGLGGPAIEIENPLAREESVLRASLLPGLLKALAANAARGEEDVALFEVGNVFAPPGPGQGLADEAERVALALGREDDDARRAVVAWWALADTLRLAQVELLAAAPPGLHPTRSARVVAGEADLGVVGEVDPAVAAAFGLPGRRVGWVELDLGRLLGAPRRPEAAAPVSRFPAGAFDLAFVVEDGVPAGRVQATLAAAAGELLEAVWLFDVYRGPQLGPGRRSLAYRLRLAALDHTLTDEELGSVRARCVAAVASAHGAELRG